MKPIIIIAALALSGCGTLPTPAEICAMPPEARAVMVEAMGSTVEAMALACAVVK